MGSQKTKVVNDVAADAEVLDEVAVGAPEAEQKEKKKKDAPQIKIVKGGKRPERKRPRHGKKYREVAAKIDKNKQYPLSEALELVKQTSQVKFDAGIEIHVQTGIDTAKSDQVVRGTVSLPHQKAAKSSKRIAVIAEESKHKDATDAGAAVVGENDLIERIEKGFLDFDVLVATPAVMPKLGKLGKVLGPKGLMPNPKVGTVIADVKKAVLELMAGRQEFRADAQGIVHGVVGKVSQETKELEQNVRAYLDALNSAKPDGVKGVYMQKASLASTMGPGVKVDIKTL